MFHVLRIRSRCKSILIDEFVKPTDKDKGGTGIKNMISRANLCNGTVTTLSSHGEGYTLQVIFRLDEW
jgi:hypothetical protein